ncbi:hypothetical protein CBG25_06005, partial [Arsenophonus sp. ENCA]|uniref:type IV secretion system DNA-binding domain-containing protein n=1 Tax=Arsenophonus sp. ENCA TaxID=1987579 RepID=UPI000BC4F376
PLLMIPSYSLAQVFGISISEQRKIYFNHRNTLISLLSNTLIEKTAMTIRTVLSAYVKALRYCQGLEKEGKPPFSIREWVQNANEDAWIFISTSFAQAYKILKMA